MAETTIEWTRNPQGEPGYTFNPWEGCQKVSPACDNCYAETRNARFSGGTAINWGPDAPRRRTSDANWKLPLRWDKECASRGVRGRVFCASLADVADKAVPVRWRIDLLSLIYRTPNLDWLLLTKRIGNAHFMLQEAACNLVGGPPTWWDAEAWPNVWIGATICNQQEADRDIQKLLAVPAAKRFLSMEPLLGPVDLTNVEMPESGHGHHEFDPIITGNALKRADPTKPRIDWVIVGGESGPNARPMHPDWARSLRDQCNAARVPFFFKQWGEWAPWPVDMHCVLEGRSNLLNDGKHCVINRQGAAPVVNDVVQCFDRVGKKAAGRILDGKELDEVPA